MRIILIFTTICLLLSEARISNAQPTYNSYAASTGTGNYVSISSPGGTTQNNLLIVGLMFEKGSTESISPPTGWTLIDRVNNGTNCGMAVYYKIAGANEAASYTFTLTQGSKWAIAISRISEFDSNFPIEASSAMFGSSGTLVTAPNLNASVPNNLILCFYTNRNSNQFSPDASTVERYDVPYNTGGLPSNMMATFVKTTTGDTGPKYATAPSSQPWIGMQVSIKAQPVPLPVTLTHFNVSKCSDGKTCLNWQTASETNNCFFTVERSADGKQWTGILDIKGAGNSSAVLNYEAKDPAPINGLNYFRLKQTDYDGKFTYSQIRTILLTPEKSSVKIYPNPATDLITLEASPDELRVIKAFNLFSEDVTYKVKRKSADANKLILNVTDLAPGIYYFKTKNTISKIYKP